MMKQRGVNDEPKACHVIDLHLHRVRRPAGRVTGRIAAQGSVAVQRQVRRHAEQLEIVQRRQPRFVDERGALRLQPDADS